MKKKIPKRVKFTSEQLAHLEASFAKSNYVTFLDLDALVEKCGLQQSCIRTWFQNKRMKLKRETNQKNTANICTYEYVPFSQRSVPSIYPPSNFITRATNHAYSAAESFCTRATNHTYTAAEDFSTRATNHAYTAEDLCTQMQQANNSWRQNNSFMCNYHVPNEQCVHRFPVSRGVVDVEREYPPINMCNQLLPSERFRETFSGRRGVVQFETGHPPITMYHQDIPNELYTEVSPGRRGVVQVETGYSLMSEYNQHLANERFTERLPERRGIARAETGHPQITRYNQHSPNESLTETLPVRNGGVKVEAGDPLNNQHLVSKRCTSRFPVRHIETGYPPTNAYGTRRPDSPQFLSPCSLSRSHVSGKGEYLTLTAATKRSTESVQKVGSCKLYPIAL